MLYSININVHVHVHNWAQKFANVIDKYICISHLAPVGWSHWCGWVVAVNFIKAISMLTRVSHALKTAQELQPVSRHLPRPMVTHMYVCRPAPLDNSATGSPNWRGTKVVRDRGFWWPSWSVSGGESSYKEPSSVQMWVGWRLVHSLVPRLSLSLFSL